jgi:hypothetical protein
VVVEIGEAVVAIGASPPVGSNYCTSHACKYNFCITFLHLHLIILPSILYAFDLGYMIRLASRHKEGMDSLCNHP